LRSISLIIVTPASAARFRACSSKLCHAPFIYLADARAASRHYPPTGRATHPSKAWK
jgi:hypothetical protein